MWQLIKTELWYNRIIVALLFLSPPIIYWLVITGVEEVARRRINEDVPWFLMLFICIVLILNIVIAQRQKEKRDLMHIMLPMSSKQVGAARLLLSLSYYGILVIVVLIMLIVLPDSLPLTGSNCLAIASALITLYGVIFISNDIFCTKRKQMMAGLMGVLLGFNFLGIFVFLKADKGNPPEWLTSIFSIVVGIVKTANTPEGSVVFLAISIGVALLSIETFKRRKSYLE
jgi:hypothetical protein